MPKKDEMIAKRSDDKEAVFDFVCPGCESEGELKVGLNEAHKPFACPEGCGATFVLWKHMAHWRLRCVVRPYFAER